MNNLECVAAYSKRPLFPITCGDIGYEADEVERNLQKHFTLAHKWGCVMLLDEADVFLAKRSVSFAFQLLLDKRQLIMDSEMISREMGWFRVRQGHAASCGISNFVFTVFLRILEYYPGILFLTTNRVGSFDDAFRSRLHMTLYYPKLNLDQTLQIYEMNIRRVRELNSKREEAGQRIIQVQDKKILKFAKRFFEPCKL
jgi:SpoVK/Ycf46/Vps4 family AAA+-type ATPase